jgi:hypothetical protein
MMSQLRRRYGRSQGKWKGTNGSHLISPWRLSSLESKLIVTWLACTNYQYSTTSHGPRPRHIPLLPLWKTCMLFPSKKKHACFLFLVVEWTYGCVNRNSGRVIVSFQSCGRPLIIWSSLPPGAVARLSVAPQRTSQPKWGAGMGSIVWHWHLTSPTLTEHNVV